MSELKPCPFCGELPIQFVKDGLTQIRCNNTQCWIEPATSFYTDRKTAVEAWEERAQPANEPLTNTGGSFNGTGNVYNGTGPCSDAFDGTSGR